MTDGLHQSLTSALSELQKRFANDLETLHLAIAVVFSALFRRHGVSCIIVGGQAAAYWMRVSGSTDVDFVSPDSKTVIGSLEKCGFVKSPDFSFRYIHRSFSFELINS